MALSIHDFLGIEGIIDHPGITDLHGPFGLHGGLAAALLLHRMRQHAPADRVTVSVDVRFLRPLGGAISIDAAPVGGGSLITAVEATAAGDGKVGMRANAVFSAAQTSQDPLFAPPFPDGIRQWDDAQVYSVPPGFSPIAARMEIRPAAPTLPYSGAAEPILHAWIRLTDDVPAPDERLMILADGIGPSYAAVLRKPKPIPTVAMSVQLSAASAEAAFDHVLVRAETTMADARGWSNERIDVWSPDGTHLVTAHQVRVLRQ